MARRPTSAADLIAQQDFVALERVAREAVRDGDRARVTLLLETVLDEVLRRWRARPLPRLGELATILGRHVSGSAGARLATDPRKKLPDDVFEALLDEADARLDIDALIEAAARGTSDAIHFRVATLRAWCASRRDPRVTSAFLRWLEAPPIRAISSQPMWSDVFDLLFDQGDPRIPAAYARLAGADFPAGKTMQRWVASQLRRELERWQQRDDREALDALVATGAEGADAAVLDALAAVVAALTGEEPVARGGQLATASVASLLAGRHPTPAADAPWRSARSADASIAIAAGTHPWTTRSTSDDGTRTALADHLQLVVVERDGRLLWRELPYLYDRFVTGFALSPSGRWLALQIDGRQLEIVDLDTRRVGRVALELPAREPVDDWPPATIASDVRTVAWAHDERALHSLVRITSDSPEHAHATLNVVFAAHFGANPHDVESVRVVHTRGTLADCPLTVHTAIGHIDDGQVVALAPDDAHLLVVCQSDHHGVEHHVSVLERCDDDWQPVNEFLLIAELAWLDAEHLVMRNRYVARRTPDSAMRRLGLRNALIEPLTGKRAVNAANAALCASRVSDETDVDEVAVPRVARMTCAADAPVVAIAPALGMRDIEVYDLVTGALRLSTADREPAEALALSADGELVAFAARGTAQLKATSGSRKAIKLKGHKDPIAELVFTGGTPTRVLSRAADGVMLWSTEGERLLDLRQRTAACAMALHPGEAALAIGETDRVSVIDLHSGHEVVTVELAAAPQQLCWSVDGAHLLWRDGARLMRWRVDETGNPPGVAVAHACELTALVSAPRHGVVAVLDREGRLLVLEAPDALRCMATGLMPWSELAVAHDGRILVGCGRLGARGSVTVLAPSTQPLTEAGLPAPIILTPAQAPDALAPTAGELETAISEVRRRAPSSRVATGTVDKLRTALRHATRRPRAVGELADVADEALWESLLAECGLPMPHTENPVFGMKTELASAWLVALLADAPPGLPIVEAWRRVLRTVVAPRRLPLDSLRSPFVTRLTMKTDVEGRDLRGLTALQTVALSAGKKHGDVEDIERLLGELVVEPGKTLALEWSPLPQTTRTPDLAGTPFDQLQLNGSATIRTLSGLEQLRGLCLKFQGGLTDLRDLADCTRLESLDLNINRPLASLSGLDRAVAAGAPLRDLRIFCGDSLCDLDPLTGSSTLESVWIERAGLQSLAGLAGCASLRTLELRKLDALTTLDGLDATTLTDVHLELEKLTSTDALAASADALETLSLIGCTALRSLDWLADATALRTLDLRRCEALRGLPSLERCTRLERVWLHGTRLKPADLSPWLCERAMWVAKPG